MAEGSPYDIVRRGEAQQLPALLILQGTNDDNLTPDMQQRFVAAYRERGGSVELEIYEGQPHSFISRDPAAAAAQAALVRMTAFITRQATGAGKDGHAGR
jgi:acetyl esterase